MNNFRIIGLRILKGCDHHIHKVLKENTTYFFFSGYRDAGKDFIERIESTKQSASINLYDITMSNNHRVNVEVSAIVGKNGDGKSTILEVMLRVLNNFAVAHGYASMHESLRAVNGLAACLYYEYGDDVYTIKCVPTLQKGSTLKGVHWYKGQTRVDKFYEVSKSQKSELLKQHEDQLFFSLIINYSLYAYNERVFKRENEGGTSWIQALFHKNDSYQTPLNINPMREDGIINVNKEQYLAHQRLMSMYTYAGLPDMVEQRKISDDEIAIGFACSLSDKTNFWDVCIDQYFKENSNTTLEWKDLDSFIGDGSDNSFFLSEKFDTMLISIKSFIEWFYRKAQNYTDLMLKIRDNRRRYHPNLSVRSDLYVNLERIRKGMIKHLKPKKSIVGKDTDKYMEMEAKWYERYKDTEELISRFLKDNNYSWLNYTQVYRLYVMWSIWEIINPEKANDKSFGLNHDIISYRGDDKAAARLYAAYKLFSIMDTYAPYQDNADLYDNNYTLLNYLPQWQDESIRKAIESINQDKDYTTLKLRQTQNYLSNDVLGYKSMSNNTLKEVNAEKYISFERLRTNISHALGKEMENVTLQEITSMLPPPFLVGDIVIEHNGEYYGLDSLSSGETQRVYTISTFVYHLRNLDNKQRDKIQYKNICVAFEETEQYFHPEYQRTFINYLISQLKYTNLDEISNIHVMFVTHSPFILSDIPQQNVLYLKKGDTQEVELNTFGANVNDLLHDSFFLQKGFMGEYAAVKIRSLLDFFDKKNNDWTRDDAMVFIEMIGEPIIRRKLFSLFQSHYQRMDDDMADWIRMKYHELEDKGL